MQNSYWSPPPHPCLDAASKWAPLRRWLAPILKRWFRLYDLQVVAACYGPSFPTLSPPALEAALTLPGARPEAGSGFEALCLMGANALQVVTAISLLAEQPHADEDQLRMGIRSCLARDCLAKCMQESHIPRMAVALHGPAQGAWLPPGARGFLPEGLRSGSGPITFDAETFAKMLEALLSAYFLCAGGGYFAVWRIFRWLLETTGMPWQGWSDRDVVPSGDKVTVEPVLGHFLFGMQTIFQGRTPTCALFREVKEGDETTVLKVYYKDKIFTGWAEYRRSATVGCFPGNFEERLIDEEGMGEWTRLEHSQMLGTFVSLQLARLAKKGEGSHLIAPQSVSGALPNKVAG